MFYGQNVIHSQREIEVLFSSVKNSAFSLALSIKQQLSALFLSPCFIPRHRCEKSARESRNSQHLIKQRDNIHARTHDTCVIRPDICRHDGAICSRNRKIVPYHRCARIPRLTVSVPDYGSWLNICSKEKNRLRFSDSKVDQNLSTVLVTETPPKRFETVHK